MFTKICAVCLKSGILCPRCEERVLAGEVSKLDLEIVKSLTELENSYPALHNVHFHGAIEVGKTLVILVDKGDFVHILGYGGKILREISEKTGKKKVRILTRKVEPRRFLEDLFAPATVLAINTIWLPDGTKDTKVVISRRDVKRLPASVEVLKELAKRIMDITLRVEVEN